MQHHLSYIAQMSPNPLDHGEGNQFDTLSTKCLEKKVTFKNLNCRQDIRRMSIKFKISLAYFLKLHMHLEF